MLFSNEERMIYAKRQLVEVICQLRFPESLSIDASRPAAFQDRIRQEYPQYEKKIEQLPPCTDGERQACSARTVNNYQFVSAEGRWKISLTRALSPFRPTAIPAGGICPAAPTTFSHLSRHIVPRGSAWVWVCQRLPPSAARTGGLPLEGAHHAGLFGPDGR